MPRVEAGNFDLLLMFAGALLIYGNGLVLTGAPGAGLWGSPLPRLGLDLLFVCAGYRLALRPALPVRLMPGLVACIVVTVFVIGPLATTLPLRAYLLHGLTLRYFYNVVLLPHYLLPGVFQGQQWSGAVNGMLWVLLPGAACALAAWLLRGVRFRVLIAATGAALCALAALRYPPFGAAMPPVKLGVNLADALTEIPFFLGGACLAWLEPRIAWRADLAMILFAANWTLATWAGEWDILLEWLSLPYMAICFGRNTLPGLGGLGRPGWGLFLYAFPIQQLIVARAPSAAHPILLTFALALTAGLLSWRLVDRPALRWPAAAIAHAPQ